MLNIAKHRKIMFEILREIFQSPAGNWLGFKGGTMLYFFHNLDRFSVDLDFDLLDETRKKDVFDQTEKILKKYGKIKDKTDKRFTLFFLLDYEKNKPNIKVEISKRKYPENRYETRNFYGIDVKVLKIEDAFAHKLIAATERKRFASRDFYDIYFLFSKNISFNEEIIRSWTKKNGRAYLQYLKKFIEKRIPERRLLEGIGELLDEKRKNWARNNLKKELLAQIGFAIRETR